MLSLRFKYHTVRSEPAAVVSGIIECSYNDLTLPECADSELRITDIAYGKFLSLVYELTAELAVIIAYRIRIDKRILYA